MLRKLLAAALLSAIAAMVPVHAAEKGAAPAASAPSTEQAEGTRIYLDTPAVMQVQQALSRNGFGMDEAEGNWDGQTAQSLRKYQQAKGLVPTGQGGPRPPQ